MNSNETKNLSKTSAEELKKYGERIAEKLSKANFSKEKLAEISEKACEVTEKANELTEKIYELSSLINEQ